jgi:Zn-dependent peptidase ImmA (M78 family)
VSGIPSETVVPRLSSDDIERQAEEVIAHNAGAVLKSPTRTPILEFIELAMEKDGLLFDASQELGVTKDGGRILGAFQQNPLTIRVAASLADDDTKFRFTVAHEYGHFILHGQLTIGSDVGLERTIRDTGADFTRSGPKTLSTPRDWIEWQANHFAAAILVPRATIGCAVRKVQSRIGITSNQGRIILEHKSYSYVDLNRQIGELCMIYIVSRAAMQNRLENLGILVDRRSSGWDNDFSSMLGFSSTEDDKW